MKTNKKTHTFNRYVQSILVISIVPYSAKVGNGEIMEDIEFCKADFLYMLNELNKYAVMNDVKDVSINNLTYVDCFEFIHHDVRYEREIKLLNISLDYDTHESAYEKYEHMMAVMKEGALL